MSEKTSIRIGRLILTLSIAVFILAFASLFTSCGNTKNLEDVKVPKYLKTPCVIYYTSDNCGWCVKFKPNWEAVSKDTTYNNINFYVNKNSDLFGIRGIPALIFIDKDDNVSKVVGYHSENKFRKNIQNL